MPVEHTPEQGRTQVDDAEQVPGREHLPTDRPGAGMAVRSGVRAGGADVNHNERRAGIVVRTGVRAGGSDVNHNERRAGVTTS